MIINSGVTNITRVLPFEVGSDYKKYDVVYYSGYTDPSPTPPTLHPCSQAESGHCYYTGNSVATSTITNRPYAADTEWTTGFFADVSYGATVNYEVLNYSTEFGDGYYNVLNKSENAVRATFSTNFDKRTDQETKAILHILEDSFNRGNRPSGGYSGIPWTPFAPYNQSGEFFVESFTQGYESPDVNSVSTTFFRETASTTDWKTLYIPFEGTRRDYSNSVDGDVITNYFQHDAVFLRQLAGEEELVPSQTGWYYFTGEKNVDYTAETGILGTEYNSPTGFYPLWTKDNFYFDLNQNISIPQNPRFTKQDLDNGFVMRFNEGINKNLLSFPVDLKGRTDKEALAVVHFLEHHAGVNLFQFTPPAPYDFTNKVFLAANWSHTINFKDNNDVTVNMREFPIDYLNLSTDFKSLVTVVNQPLKNLSPYWSWPTDGNATGPVSADRYAGSKSTKERIENTDFISNTGMKVFSITGHSIRTGFYLTNSGNVEIKTFIDYADPYQVFDFPSGHSFNPVVTAPGSSSFIPFYFKGFADNVSYSGPDVGTTGPEVSGVYSATLTLNNSSLENTRDPDGPITFGITGYITGFDGVGVSGPMSTVVNPYRGNDGQTPNHPSRFLIQTGYYDTSGVPLHLLSWEHPATGGDLNRYAIQYTQDRTWAEVSGIPLTDATSVRNINGVAGTGFEINRKYIQSYATDISNTAGYVQTNFYTGILVPSSLAGDAQIPEGLKNLPDPQNTGIHQKSYFLQKSLSPDVDYYYRMRSEYLQNDNYSDIVGSMYVYASGVSSLGKPISHQVSTGLSDSSAEFTDARTAIPTTAKPAFKVFLEDQAANINLSGEFIKGLVGVGIVNQEDNLDMVLTAENPTIADYLRVANTGAYADNFTGVQFILGPNFTVGGKGGAIGDNSFYQTTTPPENIDTTMVTPAIRTGFQLLTGVVNPTDSPGGGGNSNLFKPIAETPTVLIMQDASAVVGQGGVGGTGGYTKVAQTEGNKLKLSGSTTGGTPFGKDEEFTVEIEVDSFGNSADGGAGGDGIYISHPSIGKFSIRKDYNAKIFAGGGGGGGGDRFKVEKMFAQSSFFVEDNKYNRSMRRKDLVTRGNSWSTSTYVELTKDGYIRFRGAKTSWRDQAESRSKFTGIKRLSTYVGEHQGGAGGGGAGFKGSAGGVQLSFQENQRVIWETSKGGYNRIGKGNNILTDGVVNIKNSKGGDGGNYGEPGFPGESFSRDNEFPFTLIDDTKGRLAGDAGKAIITISTNTNYTMSNYRGKLLSIAPSRTLITDISGLVGYFEAGNKSYNTGTTEATNAQSVEKWVSVNDSNVYLEQNTSDNKPTLKDSQENDRTVGTGVSLTRSKTVTVEHAYFNNQKYIYFTPTTDAKIQYMHLYGASANSAAQGDIQINNTGTPYATGDAVTIVIHPIDFSISSGTVIKFRGGSEFELTSVATYNGTDRITQLTGNLSGQPLANNTRGYYRLSSLMEGFDIFYVMYPNKWFKGSGNITANSAAEGPNDKDANYQTGWMDFSLPTLTSNTCYNPDDQVMTDNTGLGTSDKALTFRDRGSPTHAVGMIPQRAWVYNLTGESLGGNLRLTARNDGNTVASDTYLGDSFTFNSSGSVLIGGNRKVGGSTVDFGFRGGIGAIVIFNRKLTGAENRKVLGVLFNKYMRTKAATASTPTSISYQNKPSDLTGLAGQIYLTS
jgi:phage-related protein